MLNKSIYLAHYFKKPSRVRLQIKAIEKKKVAAIMAMRITFRNALKVMCQMRIIAGTIVRVIIRMLKKNYMK